MDSLKRLEIYIPVEAEVKSIPLWSLPSSVLRRMGLTPGDSKKMSGSPEGIWISPAVIRRKGEKQQTGIVPAESFSSLLSSERQREQDPVRMSFVSSQKAAYKVLKNISSEKTSCTYRSRSSPLPQGSPKQFYQNAIVIYKGCIYLSIRRKKHSKKKNKCDSQLGDGSSVSSTSSVNQNTVPHHENPLQKQRISCKVPHSKKNKDNTSVSPSETTCPGSKSPDKKLNLERIHYQNIGKPKTALGPPVLESFRVEPIEGSSDPGEYNVQELSAGEAESQGDMSVDCAEVSHSSNTSRGSLITSLVKDCDFDELVQEEKIALMKARLRENEAALNSL